MGQGGSWRKSGVQALGGKQWGWGARKVVSTEMKRQWEWGQAAQEGWGGGRNGHGGPQVSEVWRGWGRGLLCGKSARGGFGRTSQGVVVVPEARDGGDLDLSPVSGESRLKLFFGAGGSLLPRGAPGLGSLPCVLRVGTMGTKAQGENWRGLGTSVAEERGGVGSGER